MATALVKRLRELTASECTFVIYRKGDVVAIGGTKNAKRDVRRALDRFGGDDFLTRKSDDWMERLARIKAKWPGVRVWQG